MRFKQNSRGSPADSAVARSLVGAPHYSIEQKWLDRFTPGAMNSVYKPTLSDLEAQGSDAADLHERAAAMTRQVFGRRVFVRAVVEVSNFCRENCHYCGMRRDNRTLARFRASTEQLAEWIISQCPPSVRDLNLQGEICQKSMPNNWLIWFTKISLMLMCLVAWGII